MLNNSIILILTFFCFSIALAQDEGYDLFQNKNYDAAIEYYENIINMEQNIDKANFGKGASSYMKEDYKNALSSFNNVLSSLDSELKSKAYYNIGNAYYKENDKEKALEFYKKSMIENPDDNYAKFNYEFLKYNKQEQQEQEQQEQQDLERAENILNALKEDEQIMQKQKIMKAKSKKLAKDW